MHRFRIAPTTHDVDVPTRSRGERVAVAFVVLVVLLVAELGARAVPARLVEAELWPSRGHHAVLAHLEDAADDGIDVVVVGGSHVLHAVDPRTLGPALGDATVLNGALLGATLEETAMWANDVLLPRAQPDVLVVGVTAAELGGSWRPQLGRAAALARSTGYRASATHVHPVVRAIHAELALVRARPLLREPWQTIDRAQRRVDPRRARDHLGAFSFPYSADRDHRAAWRALRRGGIEPVAGRAAALRDIVLGARRQGVDVVLVQPPIERDVLAAAALDDGLSLDALEAELAATAVSLDVPLLDLPADPGPELMLDPVHVSEAGRAWFTPRLAEALIGIGVAQR